MQAIEIVRVLSQPNKGWVFGYTRLVLSPEQVADRRMASNLGTPPPIAVVAQCADGAVVDANELLHFKVGEIVGIPKAAVAGHDQSHGAVPPCIEIVTSDSGNPKVAQLLSVISQLGASVV